MNIHINDNQTEATINGVEYRLTPKETTVSKQETFPEKRDWEVKSYDIAGSIWYRMEDGRFAMNPYALHVDEDFCKSKNAPIHSVLRSDGVEFTVGDYAKDVDNLDFEKIGKFEISEGIYTGKQMYVIDETGLYKCPISRISKPSKKALFKTEDGVEVFEGDELFIVRQDLGISITETWAKYSDKYPSDLPRFSTRESALQYISDNKPEYSKRQYNELLGDLLEAFQQACWIESEKKYDHLEISTWKRIQLTLIEAGKIKAEECYRQV